MVGLADSTHPTVVGSPQATRWSEMARYIIGPFWSGFGYIRSMPNDAAEIVRCPAELRARALALVLCDLAPSLRKIVARGLLEAEDSADLAHEALFVAVRGMSLRGAAWGQRQSGDI